MRKGQYYTDCPFLIVSFDNAFAKSNEMKNSYMAESNTKGGLSDV